MDTHDHATRHETAKAEAARRQRHNTTYHCLHAIVSNVVPTTFNNHRLHNIGLQRVAFHLEQRINKLRGAVARIFIGAPTEAEIEDKRLRYEDAINALKGAVAEGMVRATGPHAGQSP